MTDNEIILTLATKVMGWKRYEETDFWYGDNGNLFDSSLWNPLQDIDDMWQVLEKLRERYLNAGVFFEDSSGCWTGYAGSDGHGYIAVEAEGNTAQEAICNAALKTVPVI